MNRHNMQARRQTEKSEQSDLDNAQSGIALTHPLRSFSPRRELGVRVTEERRCCSQWWTRIFCGPLPHFYHNIHFDPLYDARDE